MERTLITGGAGFIGSHLVSLLADAGKEVVVLDNLSTGRVEHLPRRADNVRLIKGDVRDGNLLSRVLKDLRPTAVFHLAAVHYIPLCEAQPQLAVSVNIEGTVSVLKACEEAPPGRLVFASTAAVYGPKDTSHSESDAPAPMDTYGITKLAGELLVKLFHDRTGIPCAMARLFNVFGPNETNPHIIPEIVAQVRSGRTVLELGNLDPRRDYVHATDVARALSLLGTLESSDCPVFNVGSGKAYSVREVVDILASIWHEPISIAQVPGKMRAVDRPHLAADISRLRAATGWQPTVGLEMGLRQLVLTCGF